MQFVQNFRAITSAALRRVRPAQLVISYFGMKTLPPYGPAIAPYFTRPSTDLAFHEATLKYRMRALIGITRFNEVRTRIVIHN